MLNDEKNILSTLFQVRDEELAMITKQDKENLREVNQRLKQEELKFKETINYLPKVMIRIISHKFDLCKTGKPKIY